MDGRYEKKGGCNDDNDKTMRSWHGQDRRDFDILS